MEMIRNRRFKFLRGVLHKVLFWLEDIKINGAV
jgi:hypothetical protein